MSTLDNRISRLEAKAARVFARDPHGPKLMEVLETIATRLDWDTMSAEWVRKQSPVTVIAAVMFGPAEAIETAFPRLRKMSERDDATGKISQFLLEKANETDEPSNADKMEKGK